MIRQGHIQGLGLPEIVGFRSPTVHPRTETPSLFDLSSGSRKRKSIHWNTRLNRPEFKGVDILPLLVLSMGYPMVLLL